LPNAPAGTIAPRVAGAAEFSATLAWRRPEDVPEGPALCEPPGPARCRFTEADDPGSATRRLTGEIRALTRADLGAALGEVLRSLTRVATLTEATLEVGAMRSVAPGVASPRAVKTLACQLREAGLAVRFEASWTQAAQQADAYLGVGGNESLLRDFLRSHPMWSLI
jgi:hypothetical protein